MDNSGTPYCGCSLGRSADSARLLLDIAEQTSGPQLNLVAESPHEKEDKMHQPTQPLDRKKLEILATCCDKELQTPARTQITQTQTQTQATAFYPLHSADKLKDQDDHQHVWRVAAPFLPPSTVQTRGAWRNCCGNPLPALRCAPECMRVAIWSCLRGCTRVGPLVVTCVY